MHHDSTITTIETRLAAALHAQSRAKPYVAESNPLHTATLDTLVRGAGILKSADLFPQRNDYGFITQNEALNAVVIDGLTARANGRRDQRKTVSRARAIRKQQIDAIADAPVEPDPDRLVKAWAVLRPLVPIIVRIANSKSSWARRYLGAVEDDVAQVAMTRMALVLAKGEQDLDMLLVAAEQLAGETERTGRMPGNQVESKDDKRERKAIAKSRKWLMGLCNNRVMGALADLYTDRNNLRWENLDIIETVMASINGAGDDPAFSAHNASKAPCFIASRMASPGSIDPAVIATAISAAITERGLDRLAELLLDDDCVRTDGAFSWTANAEAVFMATEHGEHKWEAVRLATAHHADPAHGRAAAARMYARQQFAFLPWLIRSVVEACDAERIGWSVHAKRGAVAIMASAFDPDAFTEDGARVRAGYLRPTIVAADAREAASIIASHLARVLVGIDDL